MLLEPRIARANVLRRKTPSQRAGARSEYLMLMLIFSISPSTPNSDWPSSGGVKIMSEPLVNKWECQYHECILQESFAHKVIIFIEFLHLKPILRCH